MSITYSECVCVCVCSLRYLPCNAHAPYCHLWTARLYNIFPHFLINGRIKKKSYWTQNVFWFSQNLLSETFLILRRNEQDMIQKMCIGLHVKYLCSCPIWMKPEFSRQNLKKKPQIPNFMVMHPVGAELFHADGQTDRHDEASSLFLLQFCERA